MQVSMYIFLWLLFPSLTMHMDECSHWLIATPIACFTSVLSTLISVNIDQRQNISWCAWTTALFDPSNGGWRDSRRVTGQIPAWTFNQSLILYWLDGWRYCNQTKITWSPRINVERVLLYSFYCRFLLNWFSLLELHVPYNTSFTTKERSMGNFGRNEGVIDERKTDVPSLQYKLTCEQ